MCFAGCSSLSVPLIEQRYDTTSEAKSSVALSLGSRVQGTLGSSLPRSRSSTQLTIGLPYNPMTVHHPIKGKRVVLVSAPLLFAGCKVLSKGGTTCVFHLLSLTGSLPLCHARTCAGTRCSRRSPFQCFLSRATLH